MIFVTVGTHEQQFNRLIKEVDRLKSENIIEEDVFIQIGYSDYIPKFCNYDRFLSYEKMEEMTKKANIVITHGGVSTFMNALFLAKKTIIVPRLEKFKEHINDHQLEFLEKTKNILKVTYVKNIEEIEECLSNINENKFNFKSNNLNFCKELRKIMED